MATSTISNGSSSGTSQLPPLIQVQDLCFAYGDKNALTNITMDIAANQVTAFIGPSGCGKSTLLRCFNRMNDRIDNARITQGRILIDGVDISDPTIELQDLRRLVGMVFQKSNPFPKSIYENVCYGLRLQGESRRSVLDHAVEQSLRAVGLWEECADRLHQSGLGLSGGQQQRLCIARAIAIHPKIILMDEPCSALDPLATLRIEDLIQQLKKEYTIVIVTHNMQQAQRCSDYTAFFYLGQMVEYASTEKIFTQPEMKQTENYVRGRYG